MNVVVTTAQQEMDGSNTIITPKKCFRSHFYVLEWHRLNHVNILTNLILF
eukprot:UN01601